MSSAQKGLFALVGLLVLLVFAGLLCSPNNDEDDNSSSAGTAEEVAETRRERPANLSGTNNSGRDDGDSKRYTLTVYVSGPDGNAVVGARATLLPTSGEDRGTVALASAGNNGRARLQDVPAGVFQLVVTAGGYVTSLPTNVRLPEEADREISIRLVAAARIEGSLFTLDGLPAEHGLVRIRSTSGGEEVFHLEPDARGSFRSGALDDGVWEIAWLESKEAIPDPRVVMMRNVNAGELVRLDVTIPGDVAQPVEGRRVGMTESSP